MQALSSDQPVISQATDGSFTLTFGVQKSTDLENFEPMNMAGLSPVI
jgi:hypothetical protein